MVETSASVPRDSLGRSAVLKLLSDVLSLAAGLVSSIVTARVLGPAGKGTLAVLFFLTPLLAQLANLGLCDIGVLRVGQGRIGLARVMSLVLTVTTFCSLLGAGLLELLGWLSLGSAPGVPAAIHVSAISVLVAAIAFALGVFANGTLNFRVTTLSTFVTAASTSTLIVVLVGVLRGGLAAAAVASLAGLVVGLWPLIRAVRRLELHLAPAFSAKFLRREFVPGVQIMMSAAFIALAAKLDVYIVYTLSGAASAGQYSVALTTAGLVGLAPNAIAYAAFPHLASRGNAQPSKLPAILFRRTIWVAFASAIPVLVLSLVALPVIFGSAYSEARGPAAVLVGGYIVSAGQWVLVRSLAGEGRISLMARSWGTTAIVMGVADIALVSAYGALGAALGWLVASTCGLAVAAHAYLGETNISIGELTPRWSDLIDLRATATRMIGRRT